MRFVAFFLLLVIILSGCSTSKKVQQVQERVLEVDTNKVIVAAEVKKTAVSKSTKDVFGKVIKNRINFTTFNAKARVEYESKQGSEEATAIIRLKKDSAMWISLRGPLGIEGFRVFITKDSVKVLNLLQKNLQYRSFGYLQEITEIPFDFTTLQDLVVGNPIFTDSNIVSYTVNSSNQLLVLMVGKLFRHLISLDNTDNKILHSKLDNVNNGRNQTCEITFGDYENTNGILFSKSRKISVADPYKLTVTIDFREYAFNQPLTFPFNIPKNYKRL